MRAFFFFLPRIRRLEQRERNTNPIRKYFPLFLEKKQREDSRIVGERGKCLLEKGPSPTQKEKEGKNGEIKTRARSIIGEVFQAISEGRRQPGKFLTNDLSAMEDFAHREIFVSVARTKYATARDRLRRGIGSYCSLRSRVRVRGGKEGGTYIESCVCAARSTAATELDAESRATD